MKRWFDVCEGGEWYDYGQVGGTYQFFKADEVITQLTKEHVMKYASAYYVSEPTEIYIFVDEKPSELPEGAALIIETKNTDDLLNAVEPYFVLGSGKG